ncbi:hypothetical protein T01_11655 [Trichinella spiralis]|uniref:Uncharacterized protein n=1 Tax=Trichinella spiralis TaxID=6334 RepID=A0A0V0ZTS2_TRISP|nr:hypothetical protein T01_11655 [Trichinella spiralis]
MLERIKTTRKKGYSTVITALKINNRSEDSLEVFNMSDYFGQRNKDMYGKHLCSLIF